MKKILFITNGHGEDLVAAHIIKNLKGKRLKIDVLPVVSKGDIFKGMRVNVIGPKKALPSGGFGLRNYSYLIKDLFAGLLSKVIDEMKAIRAKKGHYDLVVGIGDIVPLVYSMITGSEFIFVGVNKSEFYQKLAFNYTGLEKWLLKKYCSLTFARDSKTARSLRGLGIKTAFVGNPMMDAVKDIRRSAHKNIKTIGFLPGTRDDAYKNMEDFNKIVVQAEKRQISDIDFIMSVPNTLNKQAIRNIGLSPKIKTTPDFDDVLERSSVIIGLSGTANEQAAGVGIPVISFPGRGAQYNHKFAKGQKELLGDAILLLPGNPYMIAKEAIALLRDRKRILKMSKAGRARMGGPGASIKIARTILKLARASNA
jgi:hypothetical protein